VLYALLPYQEAALQYHAFEAGHTFGVIQLLLMTVFLFFMLGFFAPHDKITYDIDYLYRKAGRGFIWFCEKPLMGFAHAMENGVLKIVDMFIRFFRDPIRGPRVIIDLIGVALIKPFVLLFNLVIHPLYKYYERDLEKVKSQPIEEPITSVSIGTAVLLVLLFFALYLIVMLTHGWLKLIP
jgi:hypothetical protein